MKIEVLLIIFSSQTVVSLSPPVHTRTIATSFPKAFTVSVSKEDYLVH